MNTHAHSGCIEDARQFYLKRGAIDWKLVSKFPQLIEFLAAIEKVYYPGECTFL